MTMIHATDDFKFEWPDPADALLPWMWDQMHSPRPLPELAGTVNARVMSHVMGGRGLLVNGYPYRAMGGPPPFMAALMSGGAPSVDPVAVWEGEQLPKLRIIIERLRGRDYAVMSSLQIAHMLEELIVESAEALALTFGRAMAFSMLANQFVDFCEAELGAGAAIRATTMLQGFENESAAAGAGLSALTEKAKSLPAVATVISEGRFDAIASAQGGPEFLEALDAYLEIYGWRAPSWGQIHLATWAEDPAVPLRLIASYLQDPDHAPAAAIARARAQRDAAVLAAESELAPDKLVRFRELLAAAQKSVPVSEGRAMWQLISAGVLRIPLLALGRKLVQEGHLDSSEDVFHFRPEELSEMAAGNPAASPRLVAEQRRARLSHWESLTPPSFLGAPPPAGVVPMMARFFGRGVEPVQTDPLVVKGIAASKGVVTAIARVVMDLRDSDKLHPGEVLVCPSTAPPWTPLFAIASAVVTDAGGILSHSAIAAREYAIPAVVGTQIGTQRIPDGATVTVDGAQGTIRIQA